MRSLSCSRHLLAGLACAIFLLRTEAQTWTPTTAPVMNWQSVAASADGQRIVAAPYGGLIYTSSDGGASWAPSTAPSNLWTSVISSADGAKLLAAAEGSPLFISTNSGSSWLPSCSALRNWWSVACSGSGENLAALGSNPTVPPYTSLYCSTDSGATWAAVPNSSPEATSISASADGSRLVAISYGSILWGVGPLCLSTNWADSWECPSGGANWTSITLSADGSKILAASTAVTRLEVPAFLFGSTDGGQTWAGHPPPGYYVPELTVNPGPHMLWLASSAQGSFAAAAYGVGIYTSADFGVTWVTNNAPNTNWQCIACSADGHKMVAAVWGGLIYTAQTVPSPVLDLKQLADSLLISWIVPSRKFALEQSPDLFNWSAVSASPGLNYRNLHHEVTLPLAAGPRFYRLATP